tara:strand:- start:51 stop:236 length:186 start_codon:yes stop_codon:yes gene_type:complete
MINTIKKIYNPITNEFSSYKITYVNSNIIKSVPLAEDNTDYQAIQTWIADGGTVIDNGGGE